MLFWNRWFQSKFPDSQYCSAPLTSLLANPDLVLRVLLPPPTISPKWEGGVQSVSNIFSSRVFWWIFSKLNAWKNQGQTGFKPNSSFYCFRQWQGLMRSQVSSLIVWNTHQCALKRTSLALYLPDHSKNITSTAKPTLESRSLIE